MSRAHPPIHPLLLFFHARKYTAEEGMAWLQGRGRDTHGAMISDNCITPEDVASCDTDAVLRLAHAEMFIPYERRTTADHARLAQLRTKSK